MPHRRNQLLALLYVYCVHGAKVNFNFDYRKCLMRSKCLIGGRVIDVLH